MLYSFGIALGMTILIGICSYVEMLDHRFPRYFYWGLLALIAWESLSYHETVLGYKMPIITTLAVIGGQLLVLKICMRIFGDR